MNKLTMLLAVLLCIAPAMAEEPAHLYKGEYEYILTDEGAGSPGGTVLTNWDYGWLEAPIPEIVGLPAILGGQPLIGVADNALNPSDMPSKYSFTLVIPEACFGWKKVR